MRSLTTTLIWIVSLNVICAQVPLGFSFQTIIRDSEGKVLKNQATGLQFSILEGSAMGTVVYSETHTITTNEYGVINLTVGTGTVTEGVFADIVWGSNVHFLKTEIDPTGGSTYTISTTSQLMSVPYAMYAMKADTALKSNIPEFGNNGQMIFRNNNQWDSLPIGLPGQQLILNENGFPEWSGFSYPVINTISFSELTPTSVTIEMEIIFDGGQNVTSRGVAYYYEKNPTLSNFFTQNGSGTGVYTTKISNLTPNTSYFIRGFGTNEIGTGYSNNINITTPSLPENTIIDVNGNIYNIVTIGNQFWLKENLKVENFRNGTEIQNITSSTGWSNSTSSAWSFYENNENYNSSYGKLYNWHAIKGDSLCPIGWHVPTDVEWDTLVSFLGGGAIAGGKLKDFESSLWNTPNTGASNEVGFTALPAGYITSSGVFDKIGQGARWWTSTIIDLNSAWNISIDYNSSETKKVNHSYEHGFSVRCIRD